MGKVATILGKEAASAEPMVAVVRCNGTCAARPRTNQYDGVQSCAIASTLYGGETGCSFGCLGYGDCVAACNFDAIHINLEPRKHAPTLVSAVANVQRNARSKQLQWKTTWPTSITQNVAYAASA